MQVVMGFFAYPLLSDPGNCTRGSIEGIAMIRKGFRELEMELLWKKLLGMGR
jgi:hypothetical protein